MFAGVPKLIQTNKDLNMTVLHFKEPSVEVLAIQYLSEPSVMATCLLISSGVCQSGSSEINRIE